MSTDAPPPSVPRADAPAKPRGGRGFFAFGDTHLRGFDYVFWALLVYLFVATAAIDEEWAAVARFRPRLILGTFALAAAVAQIASTAHRKGRHSVPPRPTSVAWAGYVVATILATIWAFDFGLARETLMAGRLAALLSFLLLVVLVRTRRQFLVVILVFCAAYAFYLVRSYTEFLSGRVYAKAEGARMVGMGDRYADPNSFAATIVFSLPVVLWAALHTRSRLLRWCVAAYTVFGAVAVVLTKSRSGVILLSLTGIWFVFSLPSRRMRTIATLVLLAGGLVGATFVPESTRQRYLGMLTGEQTSAERASTEGRVEGYRIAYHIFGENPVLGVGPGNWAAYRMKKVDAQTMMPHNLLGQLIATLGLVGTITFAVYVLTTLVAGWDLRRRWRGTADPWERAARSFVGAMMFTLVLLAVSGLAAHNLGRENWYLAPALLLVVGSCRPESDAVPSEPTP